MRLPRVCSFWTKRDKKKKNQLLCGGRQYSLERHLLPRWAIYVHIMNSSSLVVNAAAETMSNIILITNHGEVGHTYIFIHVSRWPETASLICVVLKHCAVANLIIRLTDTHESKSCSIPWSCLLAGRLEKTKIPWRRLRNLIMWR